MDKERILSKESANDGQSVYLFYDEDEGCYKAFGKSAFYADMVLDVMKYFSEELQLPEIRLTEFNVRELRQSMTKLEHRLHEFYHFRTRSSIGDAGYENWKSNCGF
ncbi:MAG: hypothetical protein IKY01_01650 [Prevotella sp.]|nr:hypothetical protein [Prevotella sp.]